MLLGTLGASLLVNWLTGKGIVRAGWGRRSLNSSASYRPSSSNSYENKKGKGIVGAGTGRPSSSTSYENKKERNFWSCVIL